MQPGILAIDIGGIGIKAAVLDRSGALLSERLRVPTPQPCNPTLLIDTVVDLVSPLPPYDRLSIGFPGAVRDGQILTAANVGGAAWIGFDLANALSQRLGGVPARIVNDADMQGYALMSGVGLELVVTLGTGFGTALFRNGELMPHMELAHHPVSGDLTYDQFLGDAALKQVGKARWNERLGRAVELLQLLFHPDRILLSGGNSRNIERSFTGEVSVVPDVAGIAGGAALWRDAPA